MHVVTARDAADIMKPLFDGCGSEKVAVAHLDSGCRLIALSEPLLGTRGEVELPIRAIVGEALRYGSCALIVAHNHPSGDARPSQADFEATKALAAATAPLGIRLYDHLIFGEGDCCSFRGMGLL